MILAAKQYSDMCAVDWLEWVGAVEGPNCRAVVLGKPAAGREGGEGNRSNLQCGGRGIIIKVSVTV
jgi:hypothetical protein